MRTQWQVVQLHPLMSLVDHRLLGRSFESRWLIVASRGLLMGLLGFRTLWGRGASSLRSSSIHPLQSNLRTLGWNVICFLDCVWPSGVSVYPARRVSLSPIGRGFLRAEVLCSLSPFLWCPGFLLAPVSGSRFFMGGESSGSADVLPGVSGSGLSFIILSSK